ncbi:MAG: tRNA guanosine(34) transglycosylase Tgt, partial [Chloroflexi bacterium]|nr:tRNA guanosine(34) transglycosylase Tgt [Chloroflexota bacterium]
MHFDVVARDPRSELRAGALHTPHGDVDTPTFMPVGTLATVKALTPRDVAATGAGIVLSNTYHLLLQPGVETVERLGGLHTFMRWDGPILTDSGGFQVFSLGRLREISERGVTFASHLDGAPMCLTPENVVHAQERLGADIVMPLDVCGGPHDTYAEAARSLELTQRWWGRSLSSQQRCDQALFVLVQGGLFPDLRRQAARAAVSERAPGFAIGGLSIGEPKDVTTNLLEITLNELPRDRPRYLMGVGHPRDVARYARLGVDLFDCVLPTRLGRNGTVWTDDEGTRLDLNRRTASSETAPIAPGCDCAACAHWSVGSLAALFQAREPLAYRLASMHNVRLLERLTRSLRREVLYT